MTKVKAAGTLRVTLPENSGISETGYGTWNVPATFVTCVSPALNFGTGWAHWVAGEARLRQPLSMAKLAHRRPCRMRHGPQWRCSDCEWHDVQ